MTRQRTVVPRSGRRGRRFKSCHPDQVPQAPDLRKRPASADCVPLQAPSRRPERNEEGTRGNPVEAGADFDKRPASRTAQQTPRQSGDPQGHSDPPSATKRPIRSWRARPSRCWADTGRPSRQVISNARHWAGARHMWRSSQMSSSTNRASETCHYRAPEPMAVVRCVFYCIADIGVVE